MAKKRTNVEIQAKLRGKSVERVRIHNRFAGRPLMFQIPGRSVRLGPGESETVPKDCLRAHELKSLCASGLVVVEDPAPETTGGRKTSTATPKPAREARPASEGKAGDDTRETLKRGSGDKPSSDNGKGSAGKTG